MKFPFSASSILCPLLFLLLTSCESLGLPDMWAHDQVPPAIKAEPQLVTVIPVSEAPGAKQWPRLGDVPFKPNNFSPPPVYDHYFDELAYQRSDSETDKQKVEAESPTLPPSLPSADVMPSLTSHQDPLLLPPQFLKE